MTMKKVLGAAALTLVITISYAVSANDPSIDNSGGASGGTSVADSGSRTVAMASTGSGPAN
jgi:hypothetical protein